MLCSFILPSQFVQTFTFVGIVSCVLSGRNDAVSSLAAKWPTAGILSSALRRKKKLCFVLAFKLHPPFPPCQSCSSLVEVVWQ